MQLGGRFQASVEAQQAAPWTLARPPCHSHHPPRVALLSGLWPFPQGTVVTIRLVAILAYAVVLTAPTAECLTAFQD